jgi:cation transport regulator ChaC|tara:strand:+ start:2530 stop:3144 length:615 start_codon:yes stop_codon:yes gene_type:complete
VTTDTPHHPKAQTQELDLANEESATWLFGYGSLIWKPELPFIQARPARIEGYVRRFWQGSEDHRGTPEAPGRVVTLVPDRQGQCHGVAYLVSNVDIEQTFAQLDHREKNGYTRLTLSLQLGSETAPERLKAVTGITYIANENNEAYRGPAPIKQIAEEIFYSVGPSGTNIEYLLELAEALRTRAIDDAHIFALEAEVQVLLEQS